MGITSLCSVGGFFFRGMPADLFTAVLLSLLLLTFSIFYANIYTYYMLIIKSFKMIYLIYYYILYISYIYNSHSSTCHQPAFGFYGCIF